MMPARDNIRTVAALHEHGGDLRLVIATIGEGGGAGAGEVLISQTRTFKSSERDAIGPVLEEHAVNLLLRVIPSAQTVARVTTLPEQAGTNGSAAPSADSHAVLEALALIAESELPATLPAYRRAAGTIAPGRGTSSRAVGLLTGWPMRDESAADWRTLWPGPQVGVAEVAALAALARSVGGVESAVVADPSTGGIGVLGVGAAKTVVRVTRLPARSGFDSAAASFLAETAQAAEVGAPGRVSQGLTLTPDPSAPRIGGATRDREWLTRYGVAAGAIAVFADPDESSHALVGLHVVEPTTRPPVLRRVTDWMGTPLRAGALIAACIAVLLALPLGAAYARVKMLEKQVTDEPALLARNTAAEKELAFYKLLREKRWPMTKLLADVAGAAPVGVQLDNIEIGQGEGVTVRGRADTAELVTLFRENLGKTRVFAQVTTPSTNPNAEGVQFQLTAKVPAGAAIFPAPPIDDFADKSLSERLYGEAGRASRSTGRSDRAERSSGAGSGGGRGNDRNSSRSSRASSGGGNQDTGPNGWTMQPRSGGAQAGKPAPVIPPELTDAQIAKLAGGAAMIEFGKYRSASAQSGLDPAVKERLLRDVDRLRRRVQEIQQGGSQGGGS